MIKWFAYIVLLLIFAPCLSSAGIESSPSNSVYSISIITASRHHFAADTITSKNKKEQEEKNKIKEVAKAKRQTKPAKVEENGTTVPAKPKPKRQRRPEGLERPPEIPRRNGN
jgi:hypothetical protein